MQDKTNSVNNTALKTVLQELKEDPFQKFNLAFALMTIIPFLVFFYLLVSKLSTLNILIGETGIVLFISLFLSVCGFFVSYSLIRRIIDKVIFYAAQAKHSDQLKSTFVATVSHEIRNPLLTLKMSLLNILEGLVGDINDEQKKIILNCNNIIERLKLLVNDLLDLHKIEAGMVEIKRELCNITQLLETQLKEFEVLLEKKRIRFRKEILDKELSLWADPGKMQVVINNLFGNAVKYTPEEGSINLKIYSKDGFIKLEMMNTGETIPADKLEKIFNKFERLDFSKEGTGLGLAIAKDIVELHRGKIWAEGLPEQGNNFIVLLPRDLRQSKR